MSGDIQLPVTRVDGGPQQFNNNTYLYDGQPVSKAIVAAGQDPQPPETTTKTRREEVAVVRTDAPSRRIRRRNSVEPVQPVTTGNCSTINYGDAGSGAHDHDSWQPGADRQHAKSGSLAASWWQAQDSLPKEIKTDNGLYTVKFGDCLETIAKRELISEGKDASKQSLKNEIDLIVSLNDCHYKSLDNKPDYIMTGWKLILRSDSSPSQPALPIRQEQPRPVLQSQSLPLTSELPNNGAFIPGSSNYTTDYYGRHHRQAQFGEQNRIDGQVPHYTAISLPNPQSHFYFNIRTGANAGQRIDLLAGGQLQHADQNHRGDVVLYHERGQVAKIVYLGPDDHRPPNKQLNDDGTIGPVTDPEFVNWANGYSRTTTQYAGPRLMVRNPSHIGRHSRDGGPIPNMEYTPVQASQPLPVTAERRSYDGPIPHYTAVPWSTQKQIPFFAPPEGHVDGEGKYVQTKPGQNLDVVQADNLQANDAVLVHEGNLAKVYYMGGRVENRPPNKEIYANGTAGSVKDPNFVNWVRSFYGAIPTVNPTPVREAVAAPPQRSRPGTPQYSPIAWSIEKPIIFRPQTGEHTGQPIDIVKADHLDFTDAVLVHDGNTAKVYYMGGAVQNRPPNKEINPDGTVSGISDPNFVDWVKGFYGPSMLKASERSQPPPRQTNTDMVQTTAVSLPENTPLPFIVRAGENRGKKIDLLSTGNLTRGDVVLLRESRMMAKIVYLGAIDNRPPNKQVNDDGTIGVVTDPDFVNWQPNFSVSRAAQVQPRPAVSASSERPEVAPTVVTIGTMANSGNLEAP